MASWRPDLPVCVSTNDAGKFGYIFWTGWSFDSIITIRRSNAQARGWWIANGHPSYLLTKGHIKSVQMTNLYQQHQRTISSLDWLFPWCLSGNIRWLRVELEGRCNIWETHLNIRRPSRFHRRWTKLCMMKMQVSSLTECMRAWRPSKIKKIVESTSQRQLYCTICGHEVCLLSDGHDFLPDYPGPLCQNGLNKLMGRFQSWKMPKGIHSFKFYSELVSANVGSFAVKIHTQAVG